MPNATDIIISGIDAALASLGVLIWAMRVTEPDVCTEAAAEMDYPAPDEDDDDDDDGNPPPSAVVSGNEAHS